MKKYRHFLSVVIALSLFWAGTVGIQAQELRNNHLPLYGADEDFVPVNMVEPGVYTFPRIGQRSNEIDDLFSTTTFTFGDLVVFSYYDQTEIDIYDSGDNLVESFTLDEDEYHYSDLPSGIYRVEGNSTYSLLVGDPVENTVQGYFAVNENGAPLSTRLNTYYSQQFGTDHFIIFAYTDGTEFQLYNLDTGVLVATGVLDQGEHFVYEENDVFLQVRANHPVSALSYTDQGYYYPSSNGSFTGTLFYGFSGFVGDWSNGIIVTAYEDGAEVSIRNTETDELIWSGLLNEGEVHSETTTSDTYVTVESTALVTVSNTPYAGYTGNYAYLTRHIDSDGFGIGTLFYAPVTTGRFDVLSFADDNEVTITNWTTNTLVWSGILNEGEGYTFNSGHSVYKVESEHNVSVLSSFSGWGADFMPLNYATQYPDLSVSSYDITISPEEPSVGDPIEITVNVHNTVVDVDEVDVIFYDGDPDNGGIQIGAPQTIPAIPAGEMGTVSMDWITPEIPEVHFIYVLVDPDNEIVESNESNNKAWKPLISNNDLEPPLAVTIDAPFALVYDGDVLVPNPFEVIATVFNNGDVDAVNVTAEMVSMATGLELDVTSDPAVQSLGDIAPRESAQAVWTVYANGEGSGILVYSMDFTADNAEDKTVLRGVNVPDVFPPSPPAGFHLVSCENGELTVAWDANPEPDVFGYLLYYGDQGGPPYEGTFANEGDSPIDVANNLSFTLTGLPEDGTYYLNLKAYDTTPNYSEFTDEVVAECVAEGEITVDLIPAEEPLPLPDGLVFFEYEVEINNSTDEDVPLDYWTKVLFPNGWLPDRILRRRTDHLMPSNSTFTTTLEQCVPPCAPGGEYRYYGYIGRLDGGEILEIYDFDSFLITREGGLHKTGWNNLDGWNLSGWDGADSETAAVFGDPLPESFGIETIYPNPFNPATNILVKLPQESELTVNVYNVLGQRVDVLAHGRYNAGYHLVRFDGSTLPSGIYFISAGVPGEREVMRKVMLMK